MKDLLKGYAPGSWSQVALARTKPHGRVIGIDLIPAQPPRGVTTFQGDFLSPMVQKLVKDFVTDLERRKKTSLTKQEPASPVKDLETEESKVDQPGYIDMERQASQAHEDEQVDKSQQASQHTIDVSSSSSFSLTELKY